MDENDNFVLNNITGRTRFELATTGLKVQCSGAYALKHSRLSYRPKTPWPGSSHNLVKDSCFEPGSKPRQGFMIVAAALSCARLHYQGKQRLISYLIQINLTKKLYLYVERFSWHLSKEKGTPL